MAIGRELPLNQALARGLGNVDESHAGALFGQAR
jgi:hypothetical protein